MASDTCQPRRRRPRHCRRRACHSHWSRHGAEITVITVVDVLVVVVLNLHHLVARTKSPAEPTKRGVARQTLQLLDRHDLRADRADDLDRGQRTSVEVRTGLAAGGGSLLRTRLEK